MWAPWCSILRLPWPISSIVGGFTLVRTAGKWLQGPAYSGRLETLSWPSWAHFGPAFCARPRTTALELITNPVIQAGTSAPSPSPLAVPLQKSRTPDRVTRTRQLAPMMTEGLHQSSPTHHLRAQPRGEAGRRLWMKFAHPTPVYGQEQIVTVRR